MTYAPTTKTDQEILADLQAICEKVTAFAWVEGDPHVTFSEEPCEVKKGRVFDYFNMNQFNKWEEVQ